MDTPNFTTIKQLKELLEQYDDDLAVAIDHWGNGYISAVYPEANVVREVYVEGYGIDFLVLSMDEWSIELPGA